MINKPKHTNNDLSLGDEKHLPKGEVDDGVVVVVIEVDVEEEGEVLVGVDDLVELPMEMKEEEEEAGVGVVVVALVEMKKMVEVVKARVCSW